MMVFCVIILFLIVLVLAVCILFCWMSLVCKAELMEYRLKRIEDELWVTEGEEQEQEQIDPKEGAKGDIVKKVKDALQEEQEEPEK